MKDFTFSENLGLVDIYESTIEKLSDCDDLGLIEAQNLSSLIVDGKVCLFYSILDIEVSEDCVLIGIYFPFIKHYHSIYLGKLLDSAVFNARRRDFINFFGLLLNPVDLYLIEGGVYQKHTNLQGGDLNLLNKEIRSAKFSSPYEISNIVAGYLSLPTGNAVRNKIDEGLNKFISSILVTFNGATFDLFIVEQILFYNNEGFRGINFNDIETSIDKEDPTKCIECCYNKTSEIINRKFDLFKGRDFPFNYNINRSLMHFDVYEFIQTQSSMQNLYVNKARIYLNELNKGVQNFDNFIPIELSGYAQPLNYRTFPNLDFLQLYNFNDLYYTHKMLESKDVLSHLKSRFMFFRLFKSDETNFAFSLGQKDSKLGVVYIKNALDGDYNSVTKQRNLTGQKITKNNLIFLHNYELALPIYDEIFDGVDDYLNGSNNLPNSTIQIAGTDVKLGFGGLHSSSFISKEFSDPKELLDVTEGSKIKSKIILSDCDNVIIDLDVASFYVVIILQLFKKVGDQTKYEFFENLINVRTKLKKEKDPLQLIYKIIILSVTGQFNLSTSPVFDPLMYFSMTANGQLIILEILLKLEKEGLINKLLGCNTDGFTVEVPRSKVEDFKEFIQKYEEGFGIKFDTFDYIKSIMIFAVNKYIINYDDGQFKFKGFPVGFFEFNKFVLLEILKNLESPKIPLDLIWESFNKCYDGLVNTNPLSPLLTGYKSYGGEKKIFYFSATPDSFAGIEVGGQRSFWQNDDVFPVKEFNLQRDIFNALRLGSCKGYGDDIIFEALMSVKLSKAAYFKFVLLELVKSGLFSDEFSFENFNKENKEDFLKNLFDNYPITQSAKYLIENGGVVIPKRANKKSYKGFKQPKLKSEVVNYHQNLLYGSDGLFLKSAALSLLLKYTYPNFIVIDVDHPDALFQKGSQISEGLYEFFKKCLDSGCLILSTPTQQQVERFKLIFKLTEIGEVIEYNKFKILLEPLLAKNSLKMSLEEQASIVGLNNAPWDLLLFFNTIYNKKGVLEVTLKELKAHLDDTTPAGVVNVNNLRESLIGLRGISPANFEQKYLKLYDKGDLATKILKDYDSDLLNTTKVSVTRFYEEISSLTEETLLEIYLKNSNLFHIKKQPVEAFPNKTLLGDIFSNLTTLPKRKHQKGAFKNYTKNTKSPVEDAQFEQSFSKIVSGVTSDAIVNYQQVNFLTAKKFIWTEVFYRYILAFLAILKETPYNLDFKLKRIEFYNENLEECSSDFDREDLALNLIPMGCNLKSLAFNSNCSQKSDSQYTTGMLITENWQVLLHCFHQSCVDSHYYARLGRELSSTFLMLFLIHDNWPFKLKDGTVYTYLVAPDKEDPDIDIVI